MQRISVAQLRLNMRLHKQPFLLQDYTVRPVRDDTNLLLVTLADRTGTIGGAFYDAPDYVVNSLQNARGVEVTGRVNEHRGRIQVSIERIEPTELVSLEEYLPGPRRPMDEMRAELDALLADVENPDLAGLLAAIFDDPATYQAFTAAPAAKSYHHACYGGLLEHTLSVVRLALAALDIYPEADRDMVITVALLHDIGKMAGYDPVTFDFTKEGQLLGHLSLGALMVSRAIDALPDFSDELRLQVLHAILAHHGYEERGSPVKPMTIEARILHHADTMDGDVRGHIEHLERGEWTGGEFTEFSRMHDVRLYRGE